LETLEKIFKNKSEIGLEDMRVHRLLKGRKLIKILGDGDLKRKLKVSAHAFSQSAKNKIEKAGGTAEVIKA
jgi:large subunit ribosomal protein L15